MTIIKVSKDGKIIKKKEGELTVPLTPPTADVESHVVPVDYVMSSRSKRIVNIFLLLIALLVLSAGIIGGIYLYRYMAHRHKVSRVAVDFWCGTDDLYDDNDMLEEMPTPLPQNDEPRGKPVEGSYHRLEEEIDIQMEEELERIEVPNFDECRKSVIIHNFQKNLTVIVDNDDAECFIMPLDRVHMNPPTTLADLIRKHASGYYIPKVEVVRHQYRVVEPPIQDMTFAGRAIEIECLGYKSYMLVKKEDKDRGHSKTYGYTNMEVVVKERIYK